MIEIKKLSIIDKFKNDILSDISINIYEHKITALIGSSGSGKTTLVKAMVDILSEGLSIAAGTMYLDGEEMSKLTRYQRRRLSGKKLAFIPQLPIRAFDERMKIGKQIIELYISNLMINKSMAISMAEENLERVNLEPERVLHSYPFELSGGMLQRVIITIMLGLSPKYIIADEPTSALDDYNASIFFDLLEKNFGDSGILIITHDMNIVKDTSDYCYIMQDGRIIEEGESKDVLQNPSESWTRKIMELMAKEKSLGEQWEWKKLN
ncbi:MAG: ATP-binding cassette domain-containing protein [Eubacteriales bacterium]|nr:ATP-binding cassette domain-containing protein [Eubacteriales bacterium]